MDSLPAYDKLRLHRETCERGLAAARQCGAMERAGHYQACLDEVDRRIAELIQPIYPTRRRDALQALARAYKAKQVTPREYGLRVWGILK